MKHFKTIICLLFLILIPMACGAVVSLDSSTKTNVKPYQLSIGSSDPETNVIEYTYQGCDYFRVNNHFAAWGGHKGNCSNPIHGYILVPDDSIIPITVDSCYDTITVHGSYVRLCPRSLNEDYNYTYKIYGVITSRGKIPVIYTVHYKDEKNISREFTGTIEKCMMFGFDANEVILWSNL